MEDQKSPGKIGSEKKAQKQEKKKILKPAYHFRVEQMKIGEDDSENEVPVSELVMAEHLLADFPNFHRFESKGYEKAPLEPGDYAEWAEDEVSIIATVPGYPRIKQSRHPDYSELVNIVSVEPLLTVTPDQMKATLVLHPPQEEGRTLKLEEIIPTLTDLGVTYGIHKDGLKKIQEHIGEGAQEFARFPIAYGQPVGKSTDAYLRFDLEVGPIAGTILPDGSIDFRERRVMVGVTAGQRIATKIPAKQGEPGINIYGEETPAPEGRDLKIEILNDARYSSETMQVTALKDGVLSIVNNNVIKVCSHQVIPSDIDFETGNIESMNSVTIHGSIQPGFKTTVAGDLKLTGGVMSGHISCGGNVVIQGGITGKNSTISVDGDGDILFIEQGKIHCGGIVVVRRQSYYSEISAGSDLRCEKSSTVMGGRLVAGGDISLGEVGSENSTPAVIAAGVVFERLSHLEELKQQVVDQQEAIVQWLQRYRGSSRSKKIRNMEKELAETKLKLLRINLIPGSGIYSRVAGPDGVPVEDHEDYRNDNAIPVDKTRISVHGTIFQGTILRIGNRSLKLDKTVENRQFKLHPNGKRILAGPLKK